VAHLEICPVIVQNIALVQLEIYSDRDKNMAEAYLEIYHYPARGPFFESIRPEYRIFHRKRRHSARVQKMAVPMQKHPAGVKNRTDANLKIQYIRPGFSI
jgi:hypothetical protein